LIWQFDDDDDDDDDEDHAQKNTRPGALPL
jgi:hypothetical protein